MRGMDLDEERVLMTTPGTTTTVVLNVRESIAES